MATVIRCLLGYKPNGKQQLNARQQPAMEIGSSRESESGLPIYEEERRPLLDQHESFDCQSSGSDTITASSSSSASTGRSHWFSPRVISDAVIGLSDGLTVPFALTAGLSSLGDTKVVITGGIAELVSGAISMGLGGYLGAKSESDCYKSQLEREREAMQTNRSSSEEAVMEAMSEYGLAPSTVSAILGDLEKSPDEMVNFIMKFGRGMEEPPIGREFVSAATIGSAYFLGGFVPLFPYLFVHTVQDGLVLSSIIMVITLFIFGIAKTIFTGNNDRMQAVWGGVQMVLTGAVAAGAAFLMVRLIDSA
ncbi:VIT family-domain-containing protein [Lipomyces tetrasporus]|uniref:VIT family-domain-containing protein n=1 Tax=Lipomyces tetrasporus TaxID=54092 RepID=A0AAD7VSU8_9ASCO|nr:VIT family-domain-containing protein [Lipomyces tetrasporus]KAJ8099400.1 VIT family-domain-containing protein [Lipomyces tetrasporus]